MKHMSTSFISVAALVAIAAAGTAQGQVTKTLPGKLETATATVVTIEKASREVTVKKEDGTYEVFTVDPGIKRFDTLKVGETITAKYYDNIVLRVQAPGEKPVNSDATSVTKSETKSAATVAHQRTMTVTITAIDMKTPSITFSGPNGWTYSTHVQDTKTLAKVKVGDKVDITWTEALIVSIGDAAKK